MYVKSELPIVFTSYVNGSCGTFITAIVERLVCPTRRKPIRGNYWNNAHGSINTNTEASQNIGYFRTAKDYFNSLKVHSPYDPIFHPTHFYDPYAVTMRWPTAKNFVITHTKEDVEEIAINSLFKFALHDVMGFDDYSFQDKIKKFFTEKENILTAGYFNFDHFGPKEVKLCLEFREISVLHGGYWRVGVPDNLSHCVKEIPYSKIKDRDWTLKTISEFLGYPITSYVEKEYDCYMERQNDLFASVRNFLEKGNV